MNGGDDTNIVVVGNSDIVSVVPLQIFTAFNNTSSTISYLNFVVYFWRDW